MDASFVECLKEGKGAADFTEALVVSPERRQADLYRVEAGGSVFGGEVDGELRERTGGEGQDGPGRACRLVVGSVRQGRC